jgi:hypothetical protein
MAVRRNRIVKPYRGKLYDMVVKNFAYVPVLNAKGQQVEQTDGDGNPIKGKIAKVRRKEVTDAFEIYYNICLVDEYFKVLYEGGLKAGNPPYPMATLSKDFGKSWRFLLQKYAKNAPKGTRQLATKVEARLEHIDNAINKGLAGALTGTDINKILGLLKGATSSTDYRRTIGFYADFIKQAFNMLGINVISEVKSNPKFNIRYVQFSVGDEISDLIANSSEMVASEITKAQKLKKLRDAKLKSSLLEEGYHVETQPVYLTGGVAYLTVAYDQQATKIPKPRNKPKAPTFTKGDKEVILSLESLVTEDTVYESNTDPKEFFVAPKCSIEKDESGKPTLSYEPGEKEKNELITRQIASAKIKARLFSVPQFKEGYGRLPNGEPEAGYDSRGRPRFKYVVPKSRLKFYNRAVRLFEKLLEFRAICENKASQSLEVYNYRLAMKPLIKGVYSSDFTDELGNTYKRFNNMENLAKKVLDKRKKELNKRLAQPKISTEVITVKNYPDWDGKKVVYSDRKVKIAKFEYPTSVGSRSHNPIHHKDLLQEALNRINLGRNPELDSSLRDKVLTPSFREIKGSEGLTKTFQLVTLKDSEGKAREIIVAGRYAGYELDTILNMEGRFLEGGYVKKEGGRSVKVETDRIAFDGKGNARTVDQIQDGNTWTYKQRLIEPYITVNPKTGVLTLGIPGGNDSKADRNIMKDLASKISSINDLRDPTLPKGHMGKNPFFTFSAEDFETIRDSLGSVALSESASKFMDEYYAKLRAKENALTVENTERFTPEALGGFVSKLPNNKPFKFNNKQKEAAAWLEASGMQGVVALDTGVGKTLTSLVAIKKAINEGMEEGGEGENRRFLYISPKSLVGNLKKEVLNFMVEGGDDFVRADGKVETTPNWQKIVLDRIDEMSYEDFVADFKSSEGIDDLILDMDNGKEVVADTSRLARENKHQGKEATITYEVMYKNGQEVSRKEVDFQLGNLIDPTIVRTASRGDEVRTIQELVSYPALSPSEKEAKKKELSKSRRKLNKLKKEAKVKSSPALNKKYQDRYYACFFDEINEIFQKGTEGKDKNYAVSSLGHPRKVFLTASALDRDPVDLYRLATLAKGKVPTAKSEKAFANKYGVVLAGRMVALKPNKELQEQFHNWVKENSYFAPKMDISYDSMGVDYQEVGLPKLLELKSRTLTTRMPRAIQRKYKEEAKVISGELKAMVAKYRDLRHKLATLKDTDGEFFDRTKSKAYQDLTKATSKVKTALNKLIKISSEGMFKADAGSKVFKDNSQEKCLYFCSNFKLAESLIKKNSKIRRDKVHAVLWAKEIIFYKNGDVVAKVEDKDNMSVHVFDGLYEDKGIYSKMASEEEEDTETESTWAMDISKKYVRENDSLASAVCSDNYARGFNFQTFTKVIHLDRGKGFDSELLKQRTARAYRGGQSKQVEEIYIDATFAPESDSEGTVSDNARGLKVDLKNARSLERRELEEGKTYQTFIWDEDDWILSDTFTFTTEEDEEGILQAKLTEIFNTMGYVNPVNLSSAEEPIKRIVLREGMDINERATVKDDFDMLSIDQIKSLVNEADQDFFQDIIVNGLKSDLTARLDARVSDTGVAIKTPAMMRAVLNPTEENCVRAEKELEEYDANPLSHITFDPGRYDDADLWLAGRFNADGSSLTKKQKQTIDLMGGPQIANYIMNEGMGFVSRDKINIGSNRYITSADVKIGSDYINNGYVKAKPCAPRGFSPRFLFAEIATAKRMGIKYIVCLAAGEAGSGNYSGYAVWPKFGFTTRVNLTSMLGRVRRDNPNYVYTQAVKKIMGEDPGQVDLLDLLVITADIVTKKVPKPEADAYQRAVKAWKEAKNNALGSRPVIPVPERWEVGDRIKADGDQVRTYRPSLMGMEGVVLSVDNNLVEFKLDNGFTSRVPKTTSLISLVTPRPSVDTTAIQEEMAEWDLRNAEYESDNPLPQKPEGKESTEYGVAVGEKLWGLYGSGTTMRLNLQDGSKSMKIANAYLKKKALESNLEVNDFLNSPLDLLNTEDPWCWEQEIDKVYVKGQKVKWTDVVREYPEAYRTAWYAHKGLREKIALLAGSEKNFEAHMKKYGLIDPQTEHRTPEPDLRARQSMTVGQEQSANKEYSAENVQQRVKLGSELKGSDYRLWEDSQDPCLQAIWEKLRLENYAGQIVAELIEGEEDPDLIQAQRARKNK